MNCGYVPEAPRQSGNHERFRRQGVGGLAPDTSPMELHRFGMDWGRTPWYIGVAERVEIRRQEECGFGLPVPSTSFGRRKS